jgi:replicative DNA helicase
VDINAQLVPPNDIEAEACVLGSMMLDEKAIGVAREIVIEADFYRPAHRLLFAGLCRLADAREPVNLVMINSKLQDLLPQIGGIEYAVSLVEGVPNAGIVDYYAKIVRDKAMLRETITIGQWASQAAHELNASPQAIADAAQDKLHKLSRRLRDNHHELSIAPAIRSVMADLEARYMAGKDCAQPGIQTGYHRIDESIHGLRPGHLVTLAAATGAGKTSFALNVAANAASQGHGVLYVSAEMTAAELATRLLSSRSGVWGSKLVNANLTPEDWTQLGNADMQLSPLKIYLAGRAMDLAGIASKTRELRQQWQQSVGLIVVDYLGIMRLPQARDLRERIGLMTAGLKSLAMELECAVLMLSQFNREEVKTGKPPSLYGLKESGSIENDSNEVILLHKPMPIEILTDNRGQQYESVWCQIAKARDGTVTAWPSQDVLSGIVLGWRGRETQFYNWSSS